MSLKRVAAVALVAAMVAVVAPHKSVVAMGLVTAVVTILDGAKDNPELLARMSPNLARASKLGYEATRAWCNQDDASRMTCIAIAVVLRANSPGV